MKFLLTKVLSYLWDVQVDYRESDYNDDLIVFMVRGKYQLCSANAIYSYEDRYANFGNIFRDHVDLNALPGNKVLIMGLGLGSVPIILDQLKPGHWSFYAVEIDEVVCELAAIYGYPKIKSNIETIIGDAEVYAATCSDKFDLICIDVFIDDQIAEGCRSKEFIENINRLLTEDGLIVSNTLAYLEEQKAKSNQYFNDVFSKVFENSVQIPTHKNLMLVSNPKYIVNRKR